MKGLEGHLTFFKYFGLTLVIQILVFVLVLIIDGASPGHGILDRYVFIYAPSVIFIDRIGHFTGEGGMIYGFILGVPLGSFVYSVLGGVVGLALGRLRKQT